MRAIRLLGAPISAAICLMLLWPAALAAEVVTRSDGTEVVGRIIARDSEKITLELRRGSAVVVVEIPREAIRSIREDTLPTTRPSPATAPATQPAGPSWYRIPIAGTIGFEVGERPLRLCFKDARRRKPTVVVLEIDSVGGDAREAMKMLSVLGEARDLRLVALVRRSVGAAAVLALACPEIYLVPEGLIGDARAASPLSAKTQPATLEDPAAIRALVRSAAEQGGHSKLIAEAMADPELELSLVVADGRGEVVTGRKEGARLLVAKGKVLVLTAKEALACGLAKGIVTKDRPLNVHLGIEQWVKLPGSAENIMRYHASAARRRRRQAQRKQRLEKLRAEKEARRKQLAEEIARLDEQLADVRLQGRAAEADKAALQRQYDSEVDLAEREYKLALREADKVADEKLRLALRERARRQRDLRIAEIRKRLQPQADEITKRINELYARQQELLRRRKKLADQMSK